MGPRDDDDDLLVDDEPDTEQDEQETEADEPDPDEPDEGEDGDENEDEADDEDRKPKDKLTPAQIAKKKRETQKRVHGLLQDRYQLSTRVQDLERQLAEARGQSVETGVAGLEAEITSLRQERRRAIEDGDTDKQDDIDDKLADARIRLRDRREEQQKYPKPDPSQPQYQQAGQQPQPHPRVLEWGERVKANTWSPQELAVADAVDRSLISEGFSPDDDDFWMEADRRLEVALPNRYAQVEKFRPGASRRSKPAPTRQSRPPMTPTRGSQSQPGKGLTKEEKALMREAGYNPENPQHRQTFLKYGRAAE